MGPTGNAVAFLDEDLGIDWPHRIKQSSLRMVDPCRCVLGQLYKDLAGREMAYTIGHERYQAFLTARDKTYRGEFGSSGGSEWLKKIRELCEERPQGMDIGKEEETIYVEPVEDPQREHEQEPEKVTEDEREKVPA